MLTTDQLALLKSDMAADASLAGKYAEDIAAVYNQAALPAWYVWRSYVATVDVMANGFTWTEVDGLTAGKARIWDWMSRIGYINPSKANVRQGLRDCFGAASATYTGMLPHLKRTATRAEKLFSTGTGTEANPATMTFEGSLTYQDVEAAQAS